MDDEDILRLFGCGDDTVWTPSALYNPASEEVLNNTSNTFFNISPTEQESKNVEHPEDSTQQISLNLQITSDEHNNGDEQKETFHPISCLRCRKAHSFCGLYPLY